TATYDISDVDLSPLGLRSTPDSRIYVDVRGPTDNPELTLRSTPAMDETNIAAIIALGTPVGANTQATVERQTANLFIGLATGQLANQLEAELPIDVFELEN